MKEFRMEDVAEQLRRPNCAWRDFCYSDGDEHVVYYLYMTKDGKFAGSSETADLKFRYETDIVDFELKAFFGLEPCEHDNFRARFEDLKVEGFCKMVRNLTNRINAWFADSTAFTGCECVKECAKTIRETRKWSVYGGELKQLCKWAGLSDEYEAAFRGMMSISYEALYGRAAEILGVKIW